MSETCQLCTGSGRSPQGHQCPACLGRRFVIQNPRRCESCQGSGKRHGKPCPFCEGRRITTPLIPYTQPPRRLRQPEVAAALDAIINDQPPDSAVVGALCGLYALSSLHFNGDKERIGLWLHDICHSGDLILDIDGVWLVDEHTAKCIAKAKE